MANAYMLPIGIYQPASDSTEYLLSQGVVQDLPASAPVSGASWLDRNSAKVFGLLGFGGGPFHSRNY